ncbi:hypothetical protein EV702DRAFT_1180498 [Suillus placidus]|uniref:CxC2-like cysteine cluster KDZ transposase-associated domain-containing protein n=1 Tax=Suillus placidus TaxID=48579 RepID=A0A9P6ZQX5_9AGAM|nr:hypothetical protein EV702DRAFT_1180498 [Suillus placidus]
MVLSMLSSNPGKLLASSESFAFLAEAEVESKEVLRLEGRGNLRNALCSSCGDSSPQYRCEDCFSVDLHCSSCIKAAHQRHPLHRLQKWNRNYFERVTLKALGLHIQLGHAPGQTCPNPHRAFNDDFVVMDSHGIHEVLLDFSDPKMAATFCLLEEFHLLSFESKVLAYKFYNALVHRTDNTGLAPPKGRYESFVRMICEWQHLSMLKRSGRGHDPKCVDATGEGDCAVLCPACSHPDQNLPDNWKNTPHTKRWIYALFVAINANFRLEHKIVSNNIMDPSLKEAGYKEFLAEKIDVAQEKFTCSSHNTVNMADTKTNQGLAVTGLDTINCAHHNMKQPNTVGDLQKGEKYINMDYLFFSTLCHSSLQTLNISYDIACQWHKKLWQCMTAFPTSMQFDYVSKAISFFIPKFHLPAHCGWANINPMASNMKEMRPSVRWDTLDDFFGDWNWKKVVALGLYVHPLDDLKEGLKEEYGEVLEQWRSQVERWEDDQSRFNPLERNGDVIALTSVQLALAKEEEQSLQSGACISLYEDCSPSILISSGLELEEQQQRLRANKDAHGLHITDNQEGKLLEHSNALQCRIDSWVKMQELYMPNVAAMQISDNATAANTYSSVESFKLWLPSHIGRMVMMLSTLCAPALHAQTAILKYKDWNLCRQGANTRACNMLKAINMRIKAATGRYESVHKALVILGSLLNESGWQSALHPLNHQDICSMSNLLWSKSDGRRKISWIWNMRGTGGSEKDDNGALEDMRIEWCKARAYAMRWEEEVKLLHEEMCCIGAFLRWELGRWDARHNEVIPTDMEHEDRCMAYAQRQAHLCRELAALFEALWAQTLTHLSTQDGSGGYNMPYNHCK